MCTSISSMDTERTALVDPRALPIALGYLPVAFAFGLSAVALHLPGWFAIGLSLLVYAGASQFAALHLLQVGTPWLAAVVSIWLINLRMALEGLSFFRRVDWGRRLPYLALLLTDETFVAASLGDPIGPAAYRRLVWLPYATWVLGTALGVAAGGLLPALLRHAFGIAIDALFVSLLVEAVQADRKTLWAATAGAVGAFLGSRLGGWSLVAGMVLGAVAYFAAGLRQGGQA